MYRYKFAYNEPGIGEFDNEGPYLEQEEVIKLIEESYPDYIDIEIISEEELN